MARKKDVDPATALAQSLGKAFERRRSEGAGYPATLREVARDVAGEISDADLKVALTKAPLKTGCILSMDADLDSLAILNDSADIERLVGDERLLRGLCEKRCSAEQPVISVKELAQPGLLAKKLAKSFQTVWNGRLKAGELPAFVQVVTIPGKTAKSTESKLHDVRFPLPWLTLSQVLVQELKRETASTGPLVDWSTLAASVPPGTPPAFVALARASEPFRSAVIPVFAKEPDGCLVLAENAEQGGSDPRLFERVYAAALKSGDTAVDAALLKKQKLLSPPMSAAFLRAFDQMLLDRAFPTDYGVIRVGAKKYLFRLADLPNPARHDVRSASKPVAVAVTTLPESSAGEGFAQAFGEAFNRIDAREGGYNFVKLLHLRNALPAYPRVLFDAGLDALRKNRLYSLESSEGHVVSLSEEEREAGIVEAGRQLIYCKRVRVV